MTSLKDMSYNLNNQQTLCSCVIVFLMTQYGEYEEVTRKVYEFFGIVILLPYFINKTVNLNKNFKVEKCK